MRPCRGRLWERVLEPIVLLAFLGFAGALKLYRLQGGAGARHRPPSEVVGTGSRLRL